MDINPYIVAAIAGIGTIGVFWNYVKNIFGYISSFFIVNITVKHYELIMAINAYCFNEMKSGFFGEKSYCGYGTFVKPKERYELVGYETIGNSPIVFWKGFRPVIITSGKQQEGSNSSSPSSSEDKLTIRFLRGMFNPDKFMKDCIDYANNQHNQYDNTSCKNAVRYAVRYVVGSKEKRGMGDYHTSINISTTPYHLTYRPLGYSKSELGLKLSEDSFERLAFSEDVHDLVREAIFWKSTKQWYLQRGIPWKRGCLVYGKPGTGKTSLARALAQSLNIPIYIFDLASLDNHDFKHGWDNVKNNTPCMALFEDIDNVFEGRKNVISENKMENGLSFDMLLNSIDGVDDSSGIFTIITTNKIEKVDSALGGSFENKPLGSRPGRIDSILELKEISKEGALLLCKKIIPDHQNAWSTLIEEGLAKNETPAQFQDRCKKFALLDFFKKEK